MKKGFYLYAEGTTWNNDAKKDNFQNFKHYTLTFGDVIGPKKNHRNIIVIGQIIKNM